MNEVIQGAPTPPHLSHADLQFCLLRMPRQLIKLMKTPHYSGKIFVAGGFIRSVIANEPINDVDVFVPSKQMAEELARALSIEKKGFEVSEGRVIKTDNAITIPGVKPTVQIIHRWTFANPTSCSESFDFTICQAVIWHDKSGGGIWRSICHPNFYQDLASKRLIYTSPQRDEDAGGSMLRVLKYYQKGYRIPLDSFAAVIARLACAVDFAAGISEGPEYKEAHAAKIIRGLLREVDPDVDPNHIAHLPAEQAKDSAGAAVLRSTDSVIDEDAAF